MRPEWFAKGWPHCFLRGDSPHRTRHPTATAPAHGAHARPHARAATPAPRPSFPTVESGGFPPCARPQHFVEATATLAPGCSSPCSPGPRARLTTRGLALPRRSMATAPKAPGGGLGRATLTRQLALTRSRSRSLAGSSSRRARDRGRSLVPPTPRQLRKSRRRHASRHPPHSYMHSCPDLHVLFPAFARCTPSALLAMKRSLFRIPLQYVTRCGNARDEDD